MHTQRDRARINRARVYATAVRARGRITLPRAVREEFALEDGMQLLFISRGGRLELVPAAMVPRDQLWCFTTAMSRRIDEAEDDMATGRYQRIDKLDSLPAAIAQLTRRLG